MMVLMAKGDITGVRRIVTSASGELSARKRRIFQNTAACAELYCGDCIDAARTFGRLAGEYLAECGLDRARIFGVNPPELAAHLAARGVETDVVRHAADCFDAYARALRRIAGRRGEAARAALWAFKFFDLAQAPESLIRVGQDVADDILVGVGNAEQARAFLWNTLLPAVNRLGLVDRAIAVRSQYAVLCAHCGDFSLADSEMRAIKPYARDLADGGREVANQRALIEHLRRTPRLPQVAATPQSRLFRQDDDGP